MTQLIVNADGLGRSLLVNDAIIRGHQTGIVTSTTVLINLPHSASGIESVLKNTPQLGLGLEFNLSLGHSILPRKKIPSLVHESGMFYALKDLPMVAGRFDPDELYEELNAQLERFITLTGKLPTHLSAHHHIAFLLPEALEVVLEIAQAKHLALREIPVNDSTEILWKKMQRYLQHLPQDFVLEAFDYVRPLIQKHTVYMPARFASRFYPPLTVLGDLLNMLTVLPADQPTELMCHISLENDTAMPYPHEAFQAFEAITHPAAREVSETFNIALISFADLPYPSPE